MKKSHLPEKICPVCQRPFKWRKKWEKNWNEVKYCSKRCSGERNSKNILVDNQGKGTVWILIPTLIAILVMLASFYLIKRG